MNNKLAVVKIGNEITGVYISPKLKAEEGYLQVEIIDFSQTIAPWQEKTLELIDESKLIKVA